MTTDSLTRTSGTHAKRRRVQLQPRDVSIIEAVHRLRVLSTQQIAALFFPTSNGTISSACLTRLRLLAQAGWLHRAEQELLRSDGRRPYLYMLTQESVQLLVDELGMEPEEIDWQPSYNDVRWPFLRHQLAINDMYVALFLATAAIGWRLETWVDDRILRKQHTDRVLIAETGEEVPVIPDAYFVLVGRDAGPRLQFFLEIDRATVSVAATSSRVKSWQHKIRAYQAYFDTESIIRRYGTRRIRVLTVTMGPKRVTNLKRATEEVGGKHRYWFASTEDITVESVLTAPIWETATAEGRRELIERI